MRKALVELQHALTCNPPLEIHRVEFQVSKSEPRSYRLLFSVTVFGEWDAEVTYDMSPAQMFELVQSVVRSMPNERAVLERGLR
jgi:hypothetical protein